MQRQSKIRMVCDAMSTLKSMKGAMLALLVGGIGSVWLLSQPWATATLFEPNMPTVEVSRTGATLYPASFAAAWLAIASAIAFFAFGPKIRRALGVLLIFCGAAILIAPVAFLLTGAFELLSQEHSNYQSISVTSNSLVWLMLVFGVATMFAGVVTVLWSGSWSTLSGRQSNAVTPTNRSDWDSFDEGVDPTAEVEQ